MFRSLRDWSFWPAHKPGQAILRLSENSLFSGFRFLAASGCKVLRAKPNTDLLEESRGRLATGKNPYEVVGDFLGLALYLEDHGFLFELHRSGVEDHFDLALADGFLNALRVAFLDAGEGFLAVGERDLIADLVPEPHGGLDGAVASAHHKDFLVDVMVRLN